MNRCAKKKLEKVMRVVSLGFRQDKLDAIFRYTSPDSMN